VIPLFKVAMSPSAADEVGRVLASGMIGQGAKVAEFEALLGEELANPRVLTVNSATSALHLALRLVSDTAEPSTRDEVLTTPYTCPATNWPVLANGLRIRWVDVDPGTLNVDLDDLARKISPRTAAIIVVHWAGYPVDLDRLRAIQDQAERTFGHRPPVIEDAAHAWGATYRGRRLGGHGNLVVHSFQAIKHLTTGDGGLLVLPDEESYRRAKLLRWYGINRESTGDFRGMEDIPEYGYKFHMNDINAAIGLANLREVAGIVRRHQDNAAFFDTALAGVPGVRLTERRPDRQSAHWIYSLRVQQRDGFVKRMAEAGITAGRVHDRNDAYTATRASVALLPGMDRIADEIISIPTGWWVTEEDREHIAATIRAGW
jgi:dTDP-4-amino-4,6-dideoxygalactose transaminase